MAGARLRRWRKKRLRGNWRREKKFWQASKLITHMGESAGFFNYRSRLCLAMRAGAWILRSCAKLLLAVTWAQWWPRWELRPLGRWIRSLIFWNCARNMEFGCMRMRRMADILAWPEILAKRRGAHLICCIVWIRL